MNICGTVAVYVVWLAILHSVPTAMTSQCQNRFSPETTNITCVRNSGTVSPTMVTFAVYVLLGRLLRVDLIKWVSNVCLYVRPYTKTFVDFNEIWCVGRGRWVMHDGMQYDPIQGQSQGHKPLKVGNSAIFKGYLLPHL